MAVQYPTETQFPHYMYDSVIAMIQNAALSISSANRSEKFKKFIKFFKTNQPHSPTHNHNQLHICNGIDIKYGNMDNNSVSEKNAPNATAWNKQ